MAGKAIEIKDIMKPEGLATQIADQYTEWEMYRNTWASQKKEIREYIFATDTSHTSNAGLPWKNSVHIPKLCNIRDNLQTSYMAAMFPNDRPINWEGDDEDADALDKRRVIESYMENKMRLSKFRTVMAQCVNDFIDYGNAFGMVEFVAEKTVDPDTQEETPGYVGPRAVRISPLDIVFNPIASRFEDSPKIIRTVKTLATLATEMETMPELGYFKDVLEKMKNVRHHFKSTTTGDSTKNAQFQVDGFSSWDNYMNSNYVEILDFYGDMYDPETQEVWKNYCITVVDRSYIVRKQTNPSWLGSAPIFHVGWRLRPDNLYAMGPLDNLVGMQYRIDHLENAKSDAFDLIVHPVMKVVGMVEDFEYGPGERIFVGDDGDVVFMSPDTTMLQADTQIMMYEQKMEEMAGAPKQAMGFRTPGEKTAYEVQILENGSQRVFLNKTSYFEEMFIEPLLNAMLEVARRNMGITDLIRVVDDQFGAINFMKITKEDISARGKIRPIGARHFARNANLIQNLTQFSQSPLGQDPAVSSHISGLKMAKLIEDLFAIERFDLVQENVRVMEQAKTQQIVNSAQQVIAEQMQPQGAPAAPQGIIPPNGQPAV
jgi:hypothetical protein